MRKIYYAITPKFCNVTRYANEKDFQRVYDLAFQITQNHNDAESASSWCKSAGVGDKYKTNLLTVEVIDDEA